MTETFERIVLASRAKGDIVVGRTGLADLWRNDAHSRQPLRCSYAADRLTSASIRQAQFPEIVDHAVDYWRRGHRLPKLGGR